MIRTPDPAVEHGLLEDEDGDEVVVLVLKNNPGGDSPSTQTLTAIDTATMIEERRNGITHKDVTKGGIRIMLLLDGKALLLLIITMKVVPGAIATIISQIALTTMGAIIKNVTTVVTGESTGDIIIATMIAGEGIDTIEKKIGTIRMRRRKTTITAVDPPGAKGSMRATVIVDVTTTRDNSNIVTVIVITRRETAATGMGELNGAVVTIAKVVTGHHDPPTEDERRKETDMSEVLFQIITGSNRVAVWSRTRNFTTAEEGIVVAVSRTRAGELLKGTIPERRSIPEKGTITMMMMISTTASGNTTDDIVIVTRIDGTASAIAGMITTAIVMTGEGDAAVEVGLQAVVVKHDH